MIRTGLSVLDEILSSQKEFKPFLNNYLSGVYHGKE